MHIKLSKILSAAVVCATSVSMATAASIIVPNFSFELDDLGSASFIETTPTNWVSSGSSTNQGTQLATAPPTDFVGALGSNVAFLNGDINISSATDLHTIALGDIYVLTVDAAGRDDFASSGFQIQLTNSSLTSFASSSTINPIDNNIFSSATINYTVSAGDPLIGQGLRIKLINIAGSLQTSFDNVRLDVQNIPEPSTSLVLISGLALLGLRSRRA